MPDNASERARARLRVAKLLSYMGIEGSVRKTPAPWKYELNYDNGLIALESALPELTLQPNERLDNLIEDALYSYQTSNPVGKFVARKFLAHAANRYTSAVDAAVQAPNPKALSPRGVAYRDTLKKKLVDPTTRNSLMGLIANPDALDALPEPQYEAPPSAPPAPLNAPLTGVVPSPTRLAPLKPVLRPR